MSFRWCAVALTLAAGGGCDSREPMEPGVMFEVAPDIVLTFEYETPEARLTAHRFLEGKPFRVTVERRNGEFRQCTSDTAFDRMLTDFELLKIQRRLDDKELAQAKQGRKYHRLRIASQPPMEAYEQVLSPLKDGSLSFEDQGNGYQLTLSTRSIERLMLSCNGAHAR